jgi:hypothetical protein
MSTRFSVRATRSRDTHTGTEGINEPEAATGRDGTEREGVVALAV